MAVPRKFQAQVLWEWLKWQITPDERAAAERYIQPQVAPPVEDSTLRDIATSIPALPEGDPERAALLEQLLDAVRGVDNRSK